MWLLELPGIDNFLDDWHVLKLFSLRVSNEAMTQYVVIQQVALQTGKLIWLCNYQPFCCDATEPPDKAVLSGFQRVWVGVSLVFLEMSLWKQTHISESPRSPLVRVVAEQKLTTKDSTADTSPAPDATSRGQSVVAESWCKTSEKNIRKKKMRGTGWNRCDDGRGVHVSLFEPDSELSWTQRAQSSPIWRVERQSSRVMSDTRSAERRRLATYVSQLLPLVKRTYVIIQTRPG